MSILTIAILLLLVAGLLALLELFVPSGGLLGALAAICLVGSVVCGFMIDRWVGLGAAAAAVLLSPIAVKLGIEAWQRTPIGRKVMIDTTMKSIEHEPIRVGDVGRCVSDLRPMGEIEVGMVTVQATSGGPVIRHGTRVRVIDYVDGVARVQAVTT